jgi:hypothetical protein
MVDAATAAAMAVEGDVIDVIEVDTGKLVFVFFMN